MNIQSNRYSFNLTNGMFGDNEIEYKCHNIIQSKHRFLFYF